MLQGWGTVGQDTGALGDGESGMGTNVPPGDLGQQGTRDRQTGHGVPQRMGTGGQGMGCPRGQEDGACPRGWGTAGQAPTSFQGLEDSRRGPRGQWDKVPLDGTRGQQDGWLGSRQGTRRQQQPQVQPDRFPLFLRPFVPQFPSSCPLPRVGMGRRTQGWGGHFEHVPPITRLSPQHPHAPLLRLHPATRGGAHGPHLHDRERVQEGAG